MADEIELDPAVAGSDNEPPPEPFTLPEDFASQVQEWDVPLDVLPEAVAQYKSLQTEEGVIDAFIATGQSLGFGLKELNRLFDDEVAPPAAPAAPAAPAEPEDPDRLLTAAEVTKMLADVRAEQTQFQEQQTQQQFQAKQAQTFAAIDQYFDTVDIKDQATRSHIARLAEAHLVPGTDSYDPRVALAAIERGKQDYDAWVAKEAEAYLSRKQAAASAQPTPPGGGQGNTAGGGPSGEKVDYATLGKDALLTAKDRVRARLRESGDLG